MDYSEGGIYRALNNLQKYAMTTNSLKGRRKTAGKTILIRRVLIRVALSLPYHLVYWSYSLHEKRGIRQKSHTNKDSKE